MAEMSEGVPKVETKAPVVGRVKDSIVAFLRRHTPSAHAQKSMEMYDKVSANLNGKSKEVADKLRGPVEVAAKISGYGHTAAEAMLGATAAVVTVGVLKDRSLLGKAWKGLNFREMPRSAIGAVIKTTQETAKRATESKASKVVGSVRKVLGDRISEALKTIRERMKRASSHNVPGTGNI